MFFSSKLIFSTGLMFVGMKLSHIFLKDKFASSQYANWPQGQQTNLILMKWRRLGKLIFYTTWCFTCSRNGGSAPPRFSLWTLLQSLFIVLCVGELKFNKSAWQQCWASDAFNDSSHLTSGNLSMSMLVISRYHRRCHHWHQHHHHWRVSFGSKKFGPN